MKLILLDEFFLEFDVFLTALFSCECVVPLKCNAMMISNKYSVCSGICFKGEFRTVFNCSHFNTIQKDLLSDGTSNENLKAFQML